MTNEPLRPSMTRGGGATILKWGSLAVYALAWSWLMIGLAGAGRLVVDAALLAVLTMLVLPPFRAASSMDTRGGIAAIAAGVAWAGGATVLPLLDGLASIWSTIAAALFLLPALLALRERETRQAEWLGLVGFVFGFAPVFLGALLAAGVLGPISGGLGPLWITLGTLLLIGGSIPFALVAFWAGLPPIGAALVLVVALGQVLAGLLGAGSGMQFIAALGAVSYAGGWAWLGADLLLRPGRQLAA